MATRGRQRSRTTVGQGPATPKFSSAMWSKRAAESRKQQGPTRHRRSSSLTKGDSSPPDSSRSRSLTVTAAASRGSKSSSPLKRSESTRKLLKVRDKRDRQQAKKKGSSRSKSGFSSVRKSSELSLRSKSRSGQPSSRSKLKRRDSQSSTTSLQMSDWIVDSDLRGVSSPRRGLASAGASPAGSPSTTLELSALKRERDQLLSRIAELEKSVAEQRQTIMKLKGPRKSLTDKSGGGLPTIDDSSTTTVRSAVESSSGPSRELARLRGVNLELQTELCAVRQSRDDLSKQLATVTAERDALKAKAK